MASITKDREFPGTLERIFDLVFSFIGVLFVFGFFLAHQLQHTGFLTAEFGGQEMFALYGPMVLSLLPPVLRAATGQRNLGQPMEAIANAALAFGSLWLFFVFPFDFSHLPDVLPVGMQFILSWMTDGLARIVLLLQVAIGSLTATGKLWKFVSVQNRS